MKVRADEWGSDKSGDELADYHVRPVVARGLYPPTKGPLPHHESDAALISPSAGWPCRRSGHLVSKPVPKIHCCGYLRLGEYRHAESFALHCSDGLRQPKAPVILDVQRPNGNSGWAGGRKCVDGGAV